MSQMPAGHHVGPFVPRVYPFITSVTVRTKPLYNLNVRREHLSLVKRASVSWARKRQLSG